MPAEKQAEMELPCLHKTWNSGDVILPGGNAGRKTSGDGAPVLAQSLEFRNSGIPEMRFFLEEMQAEKQAETELRCLHKAQNSGAVILPGGNAGRKTSDDGTPVQQARNSGDGIPLGENAERIEGDDEACSPRRHTSNLFLTPRAESKQANGCK
jgi:hypothetical protein